MFAFSEEARAFWPDGTTASFTPEDYPEETYLTLTYPDSLTH